MDPGRHQVQAGGRTLSLILWTGGLCAAAPAEPPAPADFFPCLPGLSVRYRVEPKGAAPLEMVETVRGPGKEPATCVLERTVQEARGAPRTEAWVRELLPDRVSNAGWEGQPTAFRTPFLVAPVVQGKKWRFNTTAFEVRAVGERVQVPAGVFEGCVRVHERAYDGSHEAESVYAPGVGLIRYESLRSRSQATRVDAPLKKKR